MASLYAVAYNGTGPTGGDSLTSNLNEYYEVSHQTAPENIPIQLMLLTTIVIERRYGMDTDLLCPRPPDDSRCWLLLLWSRPAQVSPFTHLAIYDVHRRCFFSMVLLGLFPHILAFRRRLHRRHLELRLPQCPCTTKCGQSKDPRFAVRHLPRHVRSYYVRCLSLLISL